MKHVMLYGYTAHNLGDDLFFYTICRHFPSVQFYLQAPTAYRKTFAALDNLNILPNDRIYQKVSRKVFGNNLRGKSRATSGLGIYAGGSLFMEQPDWQKSLQMMQTMLERHDYLLLIGANFGPFSSNHFLNAHRALFRQCAAISFRDEASKSLFPEIAHISKAADVVFQLPTPAALLDKGQYVIISVIYPSLRPDLAGLDEAYFSAMAKVCVALLKAGYPVVLMSFCKQEKDELAISEIRQRMPATFRPKVQTFYYNTNLTEALQLVASANAIVATRFHAMILGWLFAKPTYPIVYNRKMTDVMEESRFTGVFSKIEQIDTMDATEVLRAVEGPVFDVKALTQDAATHIRLIDSYIEGKDND